MTKKSENYDVITKLYTTLASATRRDKEFSLGLLYINNLMKQTHCAYTGRAFTPSDRLSFERLDNSVGYVEGNVVPVCCSINNLRGSKTMAELRHQLKQAQDNAEYAAANIDSYVELTREKIIERFYNDKNTKNECIRTNVNSIKKNKIRVTTASACIQSIERKRELMNDPSWQAHCYPAHQKCVTKSCAAIVKANEVIDNFIAIHYKPTSFQDKFIRYSNEVKELTALIKGLEKFENLSRRDKACIKYGLPLGSSITLLLKNKLLYNFS